MTNRPDFKPMLAASGSLEAVKRMYDEGAQVYSSIKLDGIRCFVHPTHGPITRTGKAIANHHIRQCLDYEPYYGLDGELIVGNTFQETQTGVMTKLGRPEFTFHAFDVIYDYRTKIWTHEDPFALREQRLYSLYKAYNSDQYPWPANVQILPHAKLKTFEDFVLMYEGSVPKFEGVMVNDGGQPYKMGRSTLKERGLMKLKPRHDDEGVIIDFTPLVDKTGVVQQTVGSVQVKMTTGPFKGEIVNVGSGFTQTQRHDMWHNWINFVKKTITIEYQLAGSKDKPRQPVFTRFRYTEEA